MSENDNERAACAKQWAIDSGGKEFDSLGYRYWMGWQAHAAISPAAAASEIGAQFAARQHLQTVKTQETIIHNQQKEIDRLNAQLIEQVSDSARLRQQLAALEDRLRFPSAPMNQSTGMRCPTCCAHKGELHKATCTEVGLA